MPFKSNTRQGTDTPEEFLKCECAVLNMQVTSPVTSDAADAQATDLVHTTSPQLTRTHRAMEGKQHRTCKEIIKHDKLQAHHKRTGHSFPRWAIRRLIRLSLTEFLANLHIFKTLQACIQRTHFQDPLPTHAGFVVVSSGIIGMSFVKRILDSAGVDGHDGRAVMSETRDANGRHISPPLYHDLTSLKRDHEQAVAHRLMKLRLARLEELRSVAEQKTNLAESGMALVEMVLRREMEGKVGEWKTGNLLDALAYQQLSSIIGRQDPAARWRLANTILLAAPTERDLPNININNPLYVAVAPS
ncbi:hypothetical protein F4604DRAFT_1920070 [Suillus subluteus]|nr:hypothetical protein F4604DRAFT_1920070 [Suillus subluteus]